ncbi:MAG: alanine--tRNA ligase [Lactobacillales bacterium]|jgi:alanyl-tRNA synthetase|nr:alanine--tRNA ligase [Lactobacillales bacterium]
MTKNITAHIRKTFIDYFSKNDHTIVPSSPLVPKNDPTLMFTNSGMVQFKNYLSGAEKPPFPRAASIQKSLRAGGKHNDLDNVGYTVRHHTFFEMVGNFSFGDYFKEKAISHAWELLTKEIGIDKTKLLVTVFHTDDEAKKLWKKIAGLSDENIIPIATNANFWQMGEVGPCGPCSEIFYDHGDKYWGGRPGTPEEDGDRFIEIWNLVFDQFEDLPDGRRIETPNKSIDTGGGLERWSAILSGTNDNYGIDIFKRIIGGIADVVRINPEGEFKNSLRVIADHLRGTSFLLADGVMPSNEGRGYVLRRIMRRAMRHVHLIGYKDPLMYQLVPLLVETMGDDYPELLTHQKLIVDSLKLEEERFKQTLDKGLKLLGEETTGLSKGGELPGDVAFKLYDTYGFPLDLTQDALRPAGISVDITGFNAAMEKQKEEARKSWMGSGDGTDEKIWFQIFEKTGASEFLGYDNDTVEAQILALVSNGGEVKKAEKGASVYVVANQTPFYGEMGGQTGDTGTIKTPTGEIQITQTLRKAGQSLIVHEGKVVQGYVETHTGGILAIDTDRRFNIRAHHSATHLLQAALQKILGPHVHQKGSLVTPTGFRFDFTHTHALTPQELKQIEVLVNQMILENKQVITTLMAPDAAIKLGAMALFDEKYGDIVRVVSMEGNGKCLSRELCGGTHVSATGDVGLFRIVSESGISAGVRRIEAVVGIPALVQGQEQTDLLSHIMQQLKTTKLSEIEGKITTLLGDKKRLEKEVADLRQKVAVSGAAAQEEAFKTIAGTKFIGRVLAGTPTKELKPLVDAFKKQITSGVVAVVSEYEGKASLVIGVTDDLTQKYDAVKLVQSVAELIGGKGGGGRADMAQGGGSDVSQFPAVIKTLESQI